MPLYNTNGKLTTEERIVNTSHSWDSTLSWEQYHEATNIEIVDGSLQLSETEFVVPEAIEHHWYTPEASSDVWFDLEGDEDASIEGLNYEDNYLYNEYDALVGDGDNAHAEATTLDDWGGNVGNDFCIVMAFSMTTSEGYLFGQEDSNDDAFHAITADGNYSVSNDENSIKFVIGESDNRSILFGETKIDDGSPHAVILNAHGSNSEDWEIFVDGGSNEANHENVATIDGFTFNYPLKFHCRNDTGSVDGVTDTGFYEVMFGSDTLSESEIDQIFNKYSWI